MEKLSYALSKEFPKQVPTTTIAWGGSQKWLPYFLPKAFIQALYVIYRKNITNIHLGDGVMAPLGLSLKVITGCKVTITICGLDITYRNWFYQWLIPRCVARLDHVIAISNATLEECVKRGVPATKCVMIPCGVYPEEFIMVATRTDLEQLIKTPLKGKKVLITVGRLVERKGVAWFVENVMPKLGNEYIYAVVGVGPEQERIATLIKDLQLENRVKLLGKISEHDLKVLYNTSDIFVMPNIPVAGDMEGFGIVAIEAASTGLPVVASKTEGIINAVIDNTTGVLIEVNQVAEFKGAILSGPRLSRKNIARATAAKFSWPSIGMTYIEALS
jgi:glycosyltransferase involved in cell wall biosynthesis